MTQVQMDGFEDNMGIVVLAATNRPTAIDAALLRPGRFDRIIYMPLPDAAGRAKILEVKQSKCCQYAIFIDTSIFAKDKALTWSLIIQSLTGQ